jgi:hypothetical protein
VEPSLLEEGVLCGALATGEEGVLCGALATGGGCAVWSPRYWRGGCAVWSPRYLRRVWCVEPSLLCVGTMDHRTHASTRARTHTHTHLLQFASNSPLHYCCPSSCQALEALVGHKPQQASWDILQPDGLWMSVLDDAELAEVCHAHYALSCSARV